MRVSLIQLGYADSESVRDRTARVADLVRRTAADRTDAEGSGGEVPHLVVLPELWGPTAFDFRDWEERAEPLDGPIATAMQEVARECGVLLHAGSIVERLSSPGPEGKSLANTSLVFGPDGQRVAVYRKIHRFGFGSVEPKVMEAGSALASIEVADGHRAGLSTCYDLRFPELYRRLLDDGAEVFIVPAAWPTARVGAWTLLGRARAVENQCFVLACNTAGTHGGLQMGGRSQVVSPMGEVLAEAGADEELLDVTIDLADVAVAREKFPVLADRRL
ncbi:MAG TPA: carbon-nitrogen family hydrolase [Intrasporangiaceae bacterium]|nr:carbon-nitrogen family hydrolase [Intrasporangiaceae bacterium]